MSEIGKQKLAWERDEAAASHHEEHIAAFVAKGRLHTILSHKYLILFVSVFALMIALPGCYQAWKEYKSPEGIQLVHIVTDIVITPQAQAKALREPLDSMLQLLRAGRWQDSGSVAWDSYAQGIQQLTQTRLIVNRHISLDSNSEDTRLWRDARNLTLSFVEQNSTVSSDSIQNLQVKLDSILMTSDIRKGFWASIQRSFTACVKYTLFSREYLRAWESQMETDSRLAQTTRPWLQSLRFQLFHDLGNKGVLGQDGWTFYRPGIEYAVRPWVTDVRSRIVDPNDKALTDDPIAAIVAFRDQLKLWDVELVVMPVPNKETVYPDRLVTAVPATMSGTIGHGMAILDSLRARGISVVDLYSAFAQERRNDTDVLNALYLKDDTHWQLRGLMRAALEVKQILASKGFLQLGTSYPKEYVTHDCSVTREGDILAMSKLPQVANPQIVPCSQVYAVERDSLGVVVDSTLYKDDFRKARILILGDSFSRIYQTDAPLGAGWIAHLAAMLGEPVASLVSDGGASTLVREKLARKPGVLRGKTVVVWEFVERDYRFGDSGWKSIALKK